MSEVLGLSVAIVDDILADSMKLESFIRRCFVDAGWKFGLSEVRCYSSGVEILKDFEPGAFHIVFMDIIMDSINGIETARQLRKSDASLLIVFITTSREYAFEAFTIHTFDYILKPYRMDDVARVLSEAVTLLSEEEASVTLKVSRNEYKIPVRKIISAVAQDHFVSINLMGGKYLLSNMKFSEVERVLSEHEDFLTCNRGVIVNMSHISAQEEGVFIMKDGMHYPIRRHSRAKIIAAFSQYLINTMRGDITTREARGKYYGA